MMGLALVLLLGGCCLLALGMPRHFRQLWPRRRLSEPLRLSLRVPGWLLLIAALGVCVVDKAWGTGLVLFTGLLTLGVLLVMLWLTYGPNGSPLFRSDRFANPGRRERTAALVVLLIHGVAIGGLVWAPKPETETLEVPAIQGVLVPAPPTEQVQTPGKREKPPPKKPPPEPKDVDPEPQPPLEKLELEPNREPPPLEAPATEKSITREKKVEELPPPPPPEPRPSVTEAEKKDTAGAPITPPRQDANQLSNPAPAYPAISRRLREEGIVVLEVLILPDGSVGKVRIKQSSGHERLDNTAVEAVKKWDYIPARRGDTPISYWYLQPLEFSLG